MDLVASLPCYLKYNVDWVRGIGTFRKSIASLQKLNSEKCMHALVCAFNPRTLDDIMCRHLISERWDRTLFDCDFNQAPGLTVDSSVPAHIRDFDFARLSAGLIALDDHCFGCTAGSGST